MLDRAVLRALPPTLAILVSASCAAAARELPVGDGRVTDHAATGNVFACQTAFNGNGARAVGPWFHGDGWDRSQKPNVAGSVMWPDARYALTATGKELAFEGNGLPLHDGEDCFSNGLIEGRGSGQRSGWYRGTQRAILDGDLHRHQSPITDARDHGKDCADILIFHGGFNDTGCSSRHGR